MNNNNNNRVRDAPRGVVEPERYNTSGRIASNNQDLGTITPSIVTSLNFSTPAVHRVFGTASRSAARPLEPRHHGAGETSAHISLKASENVLVRVGELSPSALRLLVQLVPSLTHFRTLSSDPDSQTLFRQSVKLAISMSDSLQSECSRCIDAINDFDDTAFEHFGTTEEKVMDVMREATLLSLRDSGALSPKPVVSSSSSEAEYFEIVVQSSPFQLSFQIACDQNAISRDKADASEDSAVKAAVAKALTGSGIEMSMPVSVTVNDGDALQQLLVVFHALSMLAMEERVTERKMTRLINWAFAGGASVNWSGTAQGKGDHKGIVPLENRLLGFIER